MLYPTTVAEFHDNLATVVEQDGISGIADALGDVVFEMIEAEVKTKSLRTSAAGIDFYEALMEHVSDRAKEIEQMDRREYV